MLLATGLINDNGISQIALAFFTALFGMVGWLIKVRFDERGKIDNAEEQARIAAESAAKAAANTQNVSNGFAGSVLGKLQRIDENVDELSDSLRAHLEWHLRQEEKK